MKIHVLADMPDVGLIPRRNRGALHLTGLRLSDLRTSWEGALKNTLDASYPGDSFTVEVLAAHDGPPMFYVRDCEIKETSKLHNAVAIAGIAWVSTVATLHYVLAEGRVDGEEPKQ